MEKLLDIAKKKSDEAEIYYLSYHENKIDFENFSLTQLGNSIQSGYSLRIIKDGQIGFSYTKNLLDRNGLVENALSSLKGKVKAAFSFPKASALKKVTVYDESIEALANQRVIEDLKTLCGFMKKHLDEKGQLNIAAEFGSRSIKMLNTNGLSVEDQASFYLLYPNILFPNSYASMAHLINSTSYQTVSEVSLLMLVNLYNKALPEICIASGRLQVIFSPDVIHALMWRVNSGTNAKSIYEGISPVKDKVGRQIFNDKLTIFDDPHVGGRPDSRCFDDEGVPTTIYPLVEKGVLHGFYNNLDYAGKLGVKPTGHGFKTQMWGGEPISFKPMPSLTNEIVLPGDENINDMIRKVKRGVLIIGSLGAHSGNIPNGDFSIGLNPGLYIENGEIVGRVKDAMIAGNIYEVMKNIISIEDTVHEAPGGRFPAICFDDVMVSVG